MNLKFPLCVVTLSSILIVACNTRPAAPPAPSAAAAPAAAPAAVEEPLSLQERLAREAATRPSGVVSVEIAAAALSQAGVPIGALKQVLARPVGARYCALARTASGLVVSLCEFEDDAGAARGADLSHRTFDPLIPGRRLAHKRGTLLTLSLGTPDARRAAEASRAETAFAAL